MFNVNDFAEAVKQLEKYKSDTLVLISHIDNFDLLNNSKNEIEEVTARKVKILPTEYIEKDKLYVLNGGVCEVQSE